MESKIISTITVLFYLLSLYSCATTNSFEKANQGRPTWAQTTPIDAIHYIGIVSVAKTGVTSQYKQKAKQQALAEIASEISVVVSSNSVLSTIENKLGYSEQFSTNTSLRTEEWLAGYELVDAWENEYVYWVYYRLSKQKFAQIQKERKQNAIRSAIAKLEQADNYKENSNYTEALRFYCQTLVELKQYLAEETSTVYNGITIDPGAVAFQEISTIARAFEFQGPQKITKKFGELIDEELLTYYLLDNKTGSYLPNIPCRFSYTGLGLLSEVEKSKSNGAIQARMPKAIGTKEIERLTISVEIGKLIRELSDDLFIRNMAKSLPSAEYTTMIQLIAPRISVSIKSNNLLDKNQKANVESSIHSELLNNRIQIAKSNVDFNLMLNLNPKITTLSNRLIKVELDGNFTIQNSIGEVVFNKSLRKISNTDLTKSKALDSCIRGLKSQLNINCIRKWFNVQFR